MEYCIKDKTLLAVEGVLRSKDSLKVIALDNFELKRSELGMKISSTENVNDQLIVINKELDSAKAIVEQPVAKEYIDLSLIEDTEAAIEHLRLQNAKTTEEHEKLKFLSVFRSTFGMSREQGLEYMNKFFSRDIDTIIEDLQIFVVNIWTWKLYYSLLLYLRRGLGDQMLAEEYGTLQQATDNIQRIEWQGTQKNLAELFIELQAKGFINNIDARAIKGAFTKSDTIEQILKPAQKKNTGEDYKPSYEHVYTFKYSPKFDGIRPLNKGDSKVTK